MGLAIAGMHDSGALSTLNGTGTLRLRVRRALRPGRYQLRLTGFADGQQTSATLGLRVR